MHVSVIITSRGRRQKKVSLNAFGGRMVIVTRVLYALLACVFCSQLASAQQSGGSAAIERLAARAALERAVGAVTPQLRIVIDPMIVHANEAPGGRDSVARSTGRNRDIAHSLRARSAVRSSVMDCGAQQCVLRDADVFVSLSEPWITGDNAKVTVTTVQRLKALRRKIQYQTVNVIMKRRGNTWQVVGFEELGIS